MAKKIGSAGQRAKQRAQTSREKTYAKQLLKAHRMGRPNPKTGVVNMKAVKLMTLPCEVPTGLEKKRRLRAAGCVGSAYDLLG